MNKDFQTIGAKPTGLKGRLAGLIMNSIHSKQYKKIIRPIVEEAGIQKTLTVLDIGCGGGKAISQFSTMLNNSKIYGIDHSADMVSLARDVNKEGIQKRKVDILQGDVTNMPYPNDYFDIISAFDTINFWPDFSKAILEIKRVLKDKGILLIVNGYPKKGNKWWDFSKFKNDVEYRKELSKYGFNPINIEITESTIIIKAEQRQCKQPLLNWQY